MLNVVVAVVACAVVAEVVKQENDATRPQFGQCEFVVACSKGNLWRKSMNWIYMLGGK